MKKWGIIQYTVLLIAVLFTQHSEGGMTFSNKHMKS